MKPFLFPAINKIVINPATGNVACVVIKIESIIIPFKIIIHHFGTGATFNLNREKKTAHIKFGWFGETAKCRNKTNFEMFRCFGQADIKFLVARCQCNMCCCEHKFVKTNSRCFRSASENFDYNIFFFLNIFILFPTFVNNFIKSSAFHSGIFFSFDRNLWCT